MVETLKEHRLDVLRAAYYMKSLAAVPGGKPMMYSLYVRKSRKVAQTEVERVQLQ